MDELHDIMEKMEKLRQELNEIATQKRIIDAEVITVSKQLDAIINQYQKLLRKKTD